MRCRERRWRGRCWTIHPFLPKLHAKFEALHICCIVMEFCSEGDLHPLCHKEIVSDGEGCDVWKLFVCWENYGKVKKSCFRKNIYIHIYNKNLHISNPKKKKIQQYFFRNNFSLPFHNFPNKQTTSTHYTLLHHRQFVCGTRDASHRQSKTP